MTGDLANHDVAEFIDGGNAPAGAQRDRLRALIDAAARDLHVLRLQRASDVVHREVLGAEQLGVQPEIDLPVPPTDDQYLADTVGALELAAQHLVGVLGDLAQRLLRRDRDGEHRRRGRVQFFDSRLDDGSRQQGNDAIDLVADFLCRHVRVLLEDERDQHLRHTFEGVGSQGVDAADRVHRLFDLVSDLGLDLLWRGARQPRGDRHRRNVDVGKAIDTQTGKRK